MAFGEEGGGGDATSPLISSDRPKRHLNIVRSGNEWTASAHVITAVIGSGVLSLAWSMAQLGWVAGPGTMVVFASVTALQSTIFADCYRSPDPEHGPHRNRTYAHAVERNLGTSSAWVCQLLQQTALFGYGIAYTITASTSFRAILKANCYHVRGHDAPCTYDGSYYMLMFGGAQLLLSFMPDFHDMAWLSVVAAIMSFSYAFIGLGLGLANTISNGVIKGSITGVPMKTPIAKVWRVSQAIGDIAFAYPYSLILLEIQDTLKSPPAENKTMKKASITSIMVTTFFYLCCGCFGYAAFGSDAPGNLLTGFGFYEPYWLIDFANACIILHLLGGYQVYSQPIYQFADRYLAERVRERLPHGEAAAAAGVPGEPAARLLPDAVRGEHDSRGALRPLLQRGAGAARRAQLLAARHLLPRGDVLHPEEGAAVVHAVGRPPGVQRRLPARQRLRARWLHPGGHQPEARLVYIPLDRERFFLLRFGELDFFDLVYVIVMKNVCKEPGSISFLPPWVVMNNGVHKHVVSALQDRGMAHRFQCLPCDSCTGLKHVHVRVRLPDYLRRM